MARTSKREPSTNSELRHVDLAEVERILRFMQDHGLDEFEYEQPGFRVRLKKTAHTRSGFHAISAAQPGPPVEAHAPASAAISATVPEPPSSDLHVIKSPIVGTFYGAPSPGAEPFVTRGARVEPGQVLCIIEAMKLMNEIESDVAGEIVEILVENSNPVEYGQPLFRIRPLSKN